MTPRLRGQLFSDREMPLRRSSVRLFDIRDLDRHERTLGGPVVPPVEGGRILWSEDDFDDPRRCGEESATIVSTAIPRLENRKLEIIAIERNGRLVVSGEVAEAKLASTDHGSSSRLGIRSQCLPNASSGGWPAPPWELP